MPSRRALAFWGGLAASTAALAWMQSVPHGDVLRLELFAPTREAAGRALAAWPLGRADDYVWRDFPYLATYWVPLAAAASWAGDRYGRRLQAARWAPLAAAGLDAVENVLLLRQVAQAQRLGAAGYAAHGTAWLAPATAVVAWAKWLLVLAVAGYVVRAVFVRR
ncbi:MAG TPA: hypothetical protein VF519_13185 [Mycobacteriales bacterium]|jgi:hypothetical protein